jgi:hypothetical protein
LVCKFLRGFMDANEVSSRFAVGQSFEDKITIPKDKSEAQFVGQTAIILGRRAL